MDEAWKYLLTNTKMDAPSPIQKCIWNIGSHTNIPFSQNVKSKTSTKQDGTNEHQKT